MVHLINSLTLVVISTACPTNFKLYGDRCYYVSDVYKDYIGGSQYCQSLGNNLPSVVNDTDQTSLTKIRDSLAENFFIGLECNATTGEWKWSDGRLFDADLTQFEEGYVGCNIGDSSYRFQFGESGKWEQVWSSAIAIVVCASDDYNDDDDFCCWWLLTFVAPIVSSIFGCLFLALCCIALRRRARAQHEAMKEYAQRNVEWANEQKEYLEMLNEMKRDEWEVERRFIQVDWQVQLGNGAFGKVHQGKLPSEKFPAKLLESVVQVSELKRNDEKVAVKMLHESADRSTTLAFLDEIELMKSIGYHERLVNILACVTESEPRMLIVELCSKGDLLRYMTQRREYMLRLQEGEEADFNLVITHKQQFVFAVQIASGLEYLSHRGFVHRDIAARNILVTADDSLKIGDFGLCRKIEANDGMYLSRGGRLPIKWMAPEAVKDYSASPASDVWSFGVLLFEIVTLGGSPYAGWNIAEIVPRLERGERMERPEGCTDEMHEIMHSCWKFDPRKRPAFSELRMKVGRALEKIDDDNYYLHLDGRKEYYDVSNEERNRNEKNSLEEESEL